MELRLLNDCPFWLHDHTLPKCPLQCEFCYLPQQSYKESDDFSVPLPFFASTTDDNNFATNVFSDCSAKSVELGLVILPRTDNPNAPCHYFSVPRRLVARKRQR